MLRDLPRQKRNSISEILLKISPFLRLGRFDKPIGAILLLFPCWWGLALVQGVYVDFTLLALFTLGAFVMRAAGCVINDLFDRDIDRQVARTKNRPIASGEVTPNQALLYLVFLCTIGLGVLLQLPIVCWILGMIAAGISAIYPLTKRVLPFPQLIFGFTFPMGVLIGVAAVTPHWMEPVVLWTFLATVLWSIAYDTIYALQDISDDQRLGVGSTAILFGQHVISLVGLCYGVMHSLLGIVLYQSNAGPIGYLLLLSAFIYIMIKLMRLNQNDIEDCRQFFIANQAIGALIFLALMLR